MKPTSLLLVAFLCGCGSQPDVHKTGTLTPPQTFTFKNFVELTVDAPSVTYEWREYDVRNGSAFRPPYAELEVDLPGGTVRATDRESTNGGLRIDGRSYRGTRLTLRGDGSVNVTSTAVGNVPPAR